MWFIEWFYNGTECICFKDKRRIWLWQCTFIKRYPGGLGVYLLPHIELGKPRLIHSTWGHASWSQPEEHENQKKVNDKIIWYINSLRTLNLDKKKTSNTLKWFNHLENERKISFQNPPTVFPINNMTLHPL